MMPALSAALSGVYPRAYQNALDTIGSLDGQCYGWRYYGY